MNLINPRLAVELISGLSMGYNIAMMKNKANEVKQGANYQIAALHQTVQLFFFTEIVNKLSKHILSTSIQAHINKASSVSLYMGLPVIWLMIGIKNGLYEQSAQWCNKYSPIPLPKKLSNHSIIICNWCVEHASDMIYIASTAVAIGLVVLGYNVPFGAAMLTAITYDIIDIKGYIPRKISLFIEQYTYKLMPIISIIRGSLVGRLVSVVDLITSLNPKANLSMQDKIDRVIRQCFPTTSPSLQEFDEPSMPNNKLDFDQIKQIL